MPIGSSKLGVLGAGLVPGGSVTFNSSGNWTVPPGVKKVSITGRGSTGNPGNAGNPGNPGGPGSGGGGGASDGGQYGGAAFNPGPINALNNQFSIPQFPPQAGGRWSSYDFPQPSPVPFPLTPRVVKGGGRQTGPQPTKATYPGQSGNSGGAGSAGSAGSAGNPGNASSGLGNNFSGGAGGNAGAAGNAGNGGSGGSGGGGATNPSPRAQSVPIPGGAGGNGGGTGGASLYNPGTCAFQEATGGGGAGVTNDGQPGGSFSQLGPPFPGNATNSSNFGQGGTDANTCGMNAYNPRPTSCPAAVRNLPSTALVFPPAGPSQMTGGTGARCGPVEGRDAYATVWAASFPLAGFNPLPAAPRIANLGQRFNNTPNNANLWRAGGGGSSSTGGPFTNVMGAGGGGGRGNAGNAGGSGGAGGTGAAANPTTFNCVTVTPGSTTPIVVASPGGQVVISWNPQ